MSKFFRGRRLRRTPAIRELVRETEIRPQDLVQPYFVVEHDDPDFRKPIGAMPGQFQLGLSQLEKQVGEAVAAGLRSVILFGIPKHKDDVGSTAYNRDGIVQQAVRRLKKRFPDLVVITDVCLCEYTSHGHCGVLSIDGDVLNDKTLEILAREALTLFQAGADMVAPSDMMDGRVGLIRQILDNQGYADIPILSYAVKYASAFYGPFREAAKSAPQSGDRKSYQMDPANGREAMLEAAADAAEGADILMVKPALPYLDVLARLRQAFSLPLAAYQVSGEYSQIKAAAANGWIDEERVVLETLTSIKRAGADFILTYFAEDALRLLDK